MGTEVHVIVVAPSDQSKVLLDLAERRIAELESRWSRFIATSEISRLGSGRPVLVSSDTLDAVDRAIAAWRWTDGHYDPTVADALVAAGYDKSFDQLDSPTNSPASPTTVPTPAGVVVDRVVGAITLPAGVRIDLGGIGKGLAADMVSEMLLDQGACGASVNLGGDVRVRGQAPAESGWLIEVPHLDNALIALSAGAVATSGTTRRLWDNARGPAHHLIDPATGQPALLAPEIVTVIAGSGSDAEVVATELCLVVRHQRMATAQARGVEAMFIDDDAGEKVVEMSPRFSEFLV